MKKRNNTTKKIVDELGLSKYRVGKECLVSWTTVQFWYKGVFQPKPKHQILLDKLYEQKGGQNG